VATLYVGKLIIDEVIRLVGLPSPPASLSGWIEAGLLSQLGFLLGLELGLAILSDVLGRFVGLLDTLLSERLTNETSLRLMAHADTLDLEDFEDPELQDRLERARRQTMGRSTLLGQLLGQAQDVVTIATFGVGLMIYAPWLVALLAVALVPAFLGEAHFNALSYTLNYRRTPERRELDYVRQTGASVETAKEVKIFGLQRFLMDRYRKLAEAFYDENRRLALRRAGWGGFLAGVGTLAYYLAYAYIAWSTVAGRFTVGDLTFLAGSFRRLRTLLEGLLGGFSQVAGQALYLDDLFSFFQIEPEIRSPEDPRPFPEVIRDGFVFEDVGFTYPGADRWAVRHLSFTLGAGEILALVGENGAGKTTVVKLLSPDAGAALRGGRGPLRRPVAEGGARPGLHARRPAPDPGRAHRRPGRARRVRRLPALRRADRGADGDPHLAPLQHRAHGGPHRGAGGGAGAGGGDPRGAAGAGRPLRRAVQPPGGRGVETVLPLLADPLIPDPEIIIGDVGATVVRGDTLESVQPLQSAIDARWPGERVILERLAGIPGLERQPVPQERRCSFHTTDEELVEAVRERVSGLGVDVLHSGGRYLDVLPSGVNKGSTLRSLMAHLEVEEDRVLVAGDTLNDLALYTAGFRGVVVGNAEGGLLEATASLPGAYHARRAGAGGILEALNRAGVVTPRRRRRSSPAGETPSS
jgi:hypothetical protein